MSLSQRASVLCFLSVGLFELVACNFYSSAGRKQFEEKAPTQIVSQGFMSLGCEQAAALNEAFLDGSAAPVSETDQIVQTKKYTVWGTLTPDQHYEITVASKIRQRAAKTLASRAQGVRAPMPSTSDSVFTSSSEAEGRGQTFASSDNRVPTQTESLTSNCRYLFSSYSDWQNQKSDFLMEVAKRAEDLD